MATTNPNLDGMDQNQIINNLDSLLAAGNSINDIVDALGDVFVIGNYKLLVEKGATNIDLAKIRDSVNPVVVFNNLQAFEDAKVPVNLANIITGLDDEDALSVLPTDTDKLLEMGVGAQVIADRFMLCEGSILLGFVQIALSTLLDAGARIDGDELIDTLLEDDYLTEDFVDERDIPLLRRAGASDEALSKLQSYLDEHTIYNDPVLEKKSINTDSRQTTKIFFQPKVQVVTNGISNVLSTEWAGRILPGQTIEEGITLELKEVYGYTGRFEWSNMDFLDYAKDQKGQDIERYGVDITLFPDESDY
jgi:hypothetical protein